MSQHFKNTRFTAKTGIVCGSDSLILLAAVARALWEVLTKKRVADKPISALDLTIIQSSVVFLGSVLLFVASTITAGNTFFIPKQSTFWLSALFLVLFCTIFAFFVQNWAIKIGTPSRASLLMGSEPVFGALFAVLLFGEQMSVQGWVGGALITLPSLLVIVR